MNDSPEDEIGERDALGAAGIPDLREITAMPLDLSRDEKLRATALMMAVSYHKETIVKDGQMYQTMKAQGTNLRQTHPTQVVEAALVFEGYLRGEYNELVTKLTLNVIGALDQFMAVPDSET